MVSDCRVSHFGVAVSDIERSAKFYVEALGFEIASDTMRVGSDFQDLTPEIDADLHVRFISKGDLVIELVCDHSGAKLDAPKSDRYGLRHICVNTDDMAAQLKLIEDAGGVVHRNTLIELELPDGRSFEAVFCGDPDGMPVEVTTATPDFSRDFALLLKARLQSAG